LLRGERAGGQLPHDLLPHHSEVQLMIGHLVAPPLVGMSRPDPGPGRRPATQVTGESHHVGPPVSADTIRLPTRHPQGCPQLCTKVRRTTGTCGACTYFSCAVGTPTPISPTESPHANKGRAMPQDMRQGKHPNADGLSGP